MDHIAAHLLSANLTRLADEVRGVVDADTFVAGRAIFGQQDYAAAIAALRAEIHAPLTRAA